jgi:hypothetical protein
LTHVTDGETTKRRIVSVGFNAHRLGRNHLDDSRVTALDELGVVFELLTGTTIDLLDELSELTGNVSSVAIEDGSVTSTDLTRVVQDDNLSSERTSLLGGVVLGVRADVTTTDILDRNVLDVETNVVTGNTLNELFVVHFDGLDFSGDVSGSEGDDHTGLDDTGLDTTDGYCSNTTNLVDILEGKTEGLVGGTGRGVDGIDGLKKGLARLGTGLGFLGPSLEPGHVGGLLQHVVSVPSGDGDEGNGLGVETNLLDEGGNFLDDFLITVTRPLGGIHLVDSNNELTDTEGESKKSVLTGLTILGDTSFEFTGTGSNDKNTAIGLGSTSNHVLDEITMSGSVNDGNYKEQSHTLMIMYLTQISAYDPLLTVVLGSLELPESDIDGDTTLTLGLELVKNPSVLEGTLTEFGGFLLELLDGTLVNTTALVDQMTSGGGLSRIDVTNDDDVNVSLFLTLYEMN